MSIQHNSIGEWFDSAASVHSGQIALIVPQYRESGNRREEYTYGYLNGASSSLALSLREMGVDTGDIVAVISDSPLAITLSILGIIKAGAAYLPIDPANPPERRRRMITEAKCRAVISHEHISNDGDYSARFIIFESLPLDDGGSFTASVGENSILYALYTSGTTGMPKGVLARHKGMMNYVDWRIGQYELTSNDIALQPLSVSFDGFGANFYSTLLSGGALVYPDSMSRKDFDFINRVICAERVTNVSLIPSMYELMLRFASNGELRSLRRVILGGEKIPSGLIRLNKERYPEMCITNEYGLSETTITASACLDVSEDGLNNIGKPISNTFMYALDSEMNAVPDNAEGELYVSGICLAEGYISGGDEGKFIENKFDPYPFMFRTGDLVIKRGDGNYSLIGRLDNQVKIMGCRFDLSEVESAILETGIAKKAAVTFFIDNTGTGRLTAHVTPEKGAEIGSLKASLFKLLPEYMVPSEIFFLNEIPCTISGKADKNNLPADGHNYVVNEIKRIWEKVLQKEVCTNTPFFEAGGNSLLLINVYMQINLLYPNAVSIADLFSFVTIEKIADYISRNFSIAIL